MWRYLFLEKNSHGPMELYYKLIGLPGNIRNLSILLYLNTVRNTLAAQQYNSFRFPTVCQFSTTILSHWLIRHRALLAFLYSLSMLISRRSRSNDAPCSVRSSTNWTESSRSASNRALSNWVSFLKINWVRERKLSFDTHCPMCFFVLVKNIRNDKIKFIPGHS